MAGQSAPHEKHMGSYERAAWSDAWSMAAYLEREFAADIGLSITEIRRRYEAIPVERLAQFDMTNCHLIGDYVAKTEGQRPANFRKVTAKVGTDEKIIFLVLCLIAVRRAGKLLELRDQYRMVLAPGCGNRVTAAGAYRFVMETQSLFDYSWPYEVFEAMGLYDDDDDDDDDEDA